MTGKGHIIVYKAITDEDQSYWPEEYPIDILQQWYSDIGPVAFASQYQSSPVDYKGNFLKRDYLNFYLWNDKPELFEYTVMFVDPATSQSEKADYFSLAVGGRYQNQGYMLDLLRTRAPIHLQKELIVDKFALWHPNVVIIEATAQQLYLVQYMKKETMLSIEELKPKSAKEIKFETCAAHFNSKRALLPGTRDEFGEWQPLDQFKVFIDEWVSYPKGVNDDTIDAVSGVIDALVMGVAPATASVPIDSDDALSKAEELLGHKLTDEEQAAIEEYYEEYSGIRRNNFNRYMRGY